MAIGGFCLVLHGHLPYVLRHGVWPHGEDWLYEAAAETYLPLLETLDTCVFFNAVPRCTIGLTPVLLEQLAHEHFKKGFVSYLADRVERAKADRKDFEKLNNDHMVYLADWWVDWFQKRAEQFEKIDQDIPGAYAKHVNAGHIQILTSAATHAYFPLLIEDSSIKAQLRAGKASSKRILGFDCKGMWLPECAYRPAGPWHPPIRWHGKEYRPGAERFIADENISHFFVENHLIQNCRSEFIREGGHWKKVGWDEAQKYPGRGWRNVADPHAVTSDGGEPPEVYAFARDPDVCEKVWSGWVGYPAHPSYMEFHKKWGPKRGLRYWKITGKDNDLGQKHLYYPEDTKARLYEHASHFISVIKQRLWDYHRSTGRHGVVTATFDAELFGHWWFEGPQFLRDVMLSLNADPDIDLMTTEEALQKYPPDKACAMPEGSWGDGGDHRVWNDPKVGWMWEIEYRAEAAFGKSSFEMSWETNPQIKDVLEKAGRELLLAQASDWPFAITRGQAVDYGIKRFMQHASRFEVLIDLAEKLQQDSSYLNKLTEVEEHEIKDVDIHDIIFPEIDLNWWAL